MLRSVMVVPSRGQVHGAPRLYASRMARSSSGSNRAVVSLTGRG